MTRNVPAYYHSLIETQFSTILYTSMNIKLWHTQPYKIYEDKLYNNLISLKCVFISLNQKLLPHCSEMKTGTICHNN